MKRRSLFAAIPALFAAPALALRMPDAPVQEPETPDWWRQLTAESTKIEELFVDWKEAIRLRDYYGDRQAVVFNEAKARGEDAHEAEGLYERLYVEPHVSRQFEIEKEMSETPATTLRGMSIKARVLLCDIGVLDEDAQKSVLADAERHLGEFA